MFKFLCLITFSLFLNMTIGVILSFFKKNMGIVDVFWATGIGITALFIYTVSFQSVLSLIIVSLIALWSIRLGGFLFFTRILPGHQDKRYQKIADNWKNKKKLKTALHFYMQATLQVLICLSLYPVYLGRLPDDISLVKLCFIGLFCISLIGQAVSDIQLETFKKKGSKGVCEKGLWGICRHPNYFFEAMMWLCLSVITVPYDGYQIAFIAPVSIWIIMRFITGPYTERVSLEKRGDIYKDYQKRVPMIIPSLKLIFNRNMVK